MIQHGCQCCASQKLTRLHTMYATTSQDMDNYDDDDGPNLVSRGMGGQAEDIYPEDDPYMTGLG
jgi:hypothetical protein